MDRSSLTKPLDSQAVAYDSPTLDPYPRRLARLQVCNLNLDLSVGTTPLCARSQSHALGLKNRGRILAVNTARNTGARINFSIDRQEVDTG